MTTDVTGILFHDNVLLRIVDADDYIKRYDDPALENHRKVAEDEVESLYSEGKEPNEVELTKLYARALNLPETILSGDIEYVVNDELMQFLTEHKGEYRVAIVATNPAKASRVLASYPGIVHDVFKPNHLGSSASLKYFGENTVQVLDTSEGLENMVVKYSIVYTDIEAFRSFMADPRTNGRYDAHIQQEVMNGSDSTLVETIKQTPWTPTRIIFEIVATVLVVGLLIWWFAPDMVDSLLQQMKNWGEV